MTKKKLTVLFISLLVFPFGDIPESSAQVYSCVTAEGVHFFTDNPALIPPGCQVNPAYERKNKKGLSIVASPTAQTISTEDLLVEIDERREKQNKMVEEWKDAAEKLVTRYNQALVHLHRTRRVSTRLKIRRKIREIKEHRDNLLLKASAGSIPFKNRGTINDILAAIPP